MSSRKKRRVPAVVVAAGGLTALAAPAAHAQAPANSVRAGHSVTTVHNIDFVAAFGTTAGEQTTVDVLRDGHIIGTASGPLAVGLEGPALEVNHGPEGAPQPGDCWENFTPNVQPGDLLRVTDSTGTDTVSVDDIRITTPPFVATAADALADPGLQEGDVVLGGVARFAQGSPIPIDALDSGEVRAEGPRVRATPSIVERFGAADGDGWRAIYRAPFAVFQGGSGTEDGDRAQILGGDHAMGYGHLVPLNGAAQLVEGMEDAPGPALGCEAVAPAAPDNALTYLSDPVVNLASGDLTAGGVVSEANGGDIEVTVDDTNGDTPALNLTEDSTGTNSGTRGWRTTISREQLESLDDGTLTVSATIGGTPVNALTIDKDTVAPGEIVATPGPGTYTGAQFVTLSTGDATDRIRYRRGASATSQIAGGSISVPTTQTLTATATDKAGNPGEPKAFAYTIIPAQQQQPQQQQPAPLLGVTQPVTLPAGPSSARPSSQLRLDMLVMSRSIKRSRARREGLRVAMRVPEGANVVALRVYRRKSSGRTLIASTLRAPSGAGLYRVRLTDARLRRDLKAGRYEIEVAPGRSSGNLGATSRYRFRVTTR